MLTLALLGIIEKSAIEGQKQYHAALDKSMREYMAAHPDEFAMQGADGKPITDDQPSGADSGVASTNVEKEVLVDSDVAAASQKKAQEDAGAVDRIFGVLKAVGSGLGDLFGMIGDMFSGLPGGRDLGLVLVILVLLLSNWWTYNALKGNKNPVAVQEREVRRAARAAVSSPGTTAEDVQKMVDSAVQSYFASSVAPGGSVDLGSETATILRELNALEDRIITIRTQVVAVDAVGAPGVEVMLEGQSPVSGALDTLE